MGTHLEAERLRARPRSAGARRVPFAPVSPLRIAIWVLTALLTATLLGEIVYHFLISPRMTLRQVVVEGDGLMGAEEILAAGGISMQTPLGGLDTEGLRSALEADPRIKRATVATRNPDTLVVGLERRRGIATALVTEADRTVPILFDDEGLIFALGAEAAQSDLPVISGLTFARWTPGTRLPGMLLPLLGDLKKLRDETPSLYALLSEVKVSRTSDRAVELLIYTTAYDTPVRTGGRITVDTLKNAALLLDVLRREELEDRVSEVDLRAREVVYREKGSP